MKWASIILKPNLPKLRLLSFVSESLGISSILFQRSSNQLITDNLFFIAPIVVIDSSVYDAGQIVGISEQTSALLGNEW